MTCDNSDTFKYRTMTVSNNGVQYFIHFTYQVSVLKLWSISFVLCAFLRHVPPRCCKNERTLGAVRQPLMAPLVTPHVTDVMVSSLTEHDIGSELILRNIYRGIV